MSQTKLTVLGIAMLIFIMLGVAGGLLNIAWTYMQISFDVSVGAIGILLLVATTGSLTAAMLSGTFIGRYGIGRVLLAAVTVAALGLFGIGLSPSWLIVLGVIFFMFIGRGMIDASLNNFVSENYGTTAMNWLHASWGLGLTIAPFVMTFVLIGLGQSWRVGYYLIGLVALILAGVLLLTLRQWTVQPDDDDSFDTPEKPKIMRASAREALQQPAVLWSMVFFFCYGGVEIGTGQLVNTLFVLERGIPQETAGFWLSMYWGSFTVGRMLLGVIALRVGDTHLLRGGLLLALFGGFLLILNPAPIINMLALIGIGAGLAGVFPIFISQTPSRVGKRFSAQSIGFQVGFAGLGGAILPGIIGALSEQIGLEMIAYGIFAVALMVVVIFEILTGRYPVAVPA
ncbi:MAG: MFS transporter [Anaerolineae bacterium]